MGGCWMGGWVERVLGFVWRGVSFLLYTQRRYTQETDARRTHVSYIPMMVSIWFSSTFIHGAGSAFINNI